MHPVHDAMLGYSNNVCVLLIKQNHCLHWKLSSSNRQFWQQLCCFFGMASSSSSLWHGVRNIISCSIFSNIIIMEGEDFLQIHVEQDDLVEEDRPSTSSSSTVTGSAVQQRPKKRPVQQRMVKTAMGSKFSQKKFNGRHLPPWRQVVLQPTRNLGGMFGSHTSSAVVGCHERLPPTLAFSNRHRRPDFVPKSHHVSDGQQQHQQERQFGDNSNDRLIVPVREPGRLFNRQSPSVVDPFSQGTLSVVPLRNMQHVDQQGVRNVWQDGDTSILQVTMGHGVVDHRPIQMPEDYRARIVRQVTARPARSDSDDEVQVVADSLDDSDDEVQCVYQDSKRGSEKDGNQQCQVTVCNIPEEWPEDIMKGLALNFGNVTSANKMQCGSLSVTFNNKSSAMMFYTRLKDSPYNGKMLTPLLPIEI